MKLTSSQKNLIDEYINISRCLYNLALETRLYMYSSRKIHWNYYDLSSQLTELRKEFDWIRKLPSSSSQDVLERQEKAFKDFFDKRNGFPKFAKKDKYKSITFKNVKQDTQNRFKLEKIGSIKYFNSRKIEGKIKRATILRKNNSYYISVMVESENIKTIKIDEKSNKIGIDCGISFYISMSNGKVIKNPSILKQYEKQLRIEQRSLARKKIGSNNRNKQKIKVNKVYEKIANVRKDFQHKLSNEIVNQFNIIAVEKLNISKMLDSNILNKEILDVSWGNFLNMLKYKSLQRGKVFEQVNPAYTSQTCNSCGEIDKKSRLSQSEFACTSCGNIDNADLNASKNILDRAMSNLRKRKTLV